MLSGISASTLTQGLGAVRGPTGPSPAPSVSQTGQTEAPADFAHVLGQMAMDAIGVVKASEATSIAGVRGQATVQQVVEAVMAAEETLQTGVAIRDKVVSAYLEISRMSI